jgi:YidB-like protein
VVSTGQDLIITTDQIKQGLGSDFLNQFASKAGVSPDAASTQLSSLLPNVIDKLTPNGKSEAGGIDKLMKMFQGKVGAYHLIDRQEDVPISPMVAPSWSQSAHFSICGRAQKTI